MPLALLLVRLGLVSEWQELPAVKIIVLVLAQVLLLVRVQV